MIFALDGGHDPAILRRLPGSGFEGGENSEEVELLSPRRTPRIPLEFVVPACCQSHFLTFLQLNLPHLRSR